ncbi:MAG: uroporphyrinogen-III C-methyltransferase [Tahibacter sp.]
MDTPTLDSPAQPEPARPVALIPPRRSSAPIALLLGLIATAASAVALWQVWSIDRSNAASGQELALHRTDIDSLRRASEQERRERDTLRQRLADSENVNKSLREEVLAFGERARVLEDAINNLAAKRVSGHDALLLDEAELVLLLAQERYALFGDAAAALRASRLADSTLAAVEDPAFATLREMLAVEIRNLDALHAPARTNAIAELEKLRGDLPGMPRISRGRNGEPAQESRLSHLLGQFVRISRTGEDASGDQAAGFAPGVIALDLRAAELALASQDAAAARAALERARAAIAVDYEGTNPQVQNALSGLDRMAGALQPVPPVQLGAALTELRRLRTSRAALPADTAGGAL